MVRGAAEQAGSMEEFKQGSDEIENIIRTIDNIAFQTNIRVLNTAVEATINRITLCFCPAGDCVLAGLPCQLVQLLQFLPQSAYGFRRNSHSSLPLPTQRRLPSRMLMGMSRGSPPYPISTPHHLAPTRERLLALPDRHSPHQEKDQTPSASAVSVRMGVPVGSQIQFR